MLQSCPEKPQLTIDDFVSLSDALSVISGRVHLVVAPEAFARCNDAHRRLLKALADRRHIYGLTTGFGPLANRLVPPAAISRLQQNLVHHLASGVGPELDWSSARAMVLARLMSILQGVSGASSSAIDRLVGLLNSDLAPCIPARGTVGASGDLTPLAHLVLCFQGRGCFVGPTGTRIAGPEALAELGVRAFDLRGRDGLALVNGTSAMMGVAVLNADACGRAIDWSLALTAALCDVMNGRVEAWHPAFSSVRPHPGQARAAETMLSALAGGARWHRRPLSERVLGTDDAAHIEVEAGQDAYSLRCAPQTIGAVIDLCDWHDSVVERELNAASDNPIFPVGTAPVALHGGNFMGQHVALASDALASGVLVLAGLAERQVARLTDERLNRGLPPFLHRGPAGLNSGVMGAQVTATALLAEMRALAGGAAGHSISTNGANQDVVSLGTIAARLLADRLSDLVLIQSILALCVAQAVDLREEAGWTDLAPDTCALRDQVRKVSSPLVEDRPLGSDIEALARELVTHSPRERAEQGSTPQLH